MADDTTKTPPTGETEAPPTGGAGGTTENP
jgi:hypothetical protein